MKPALNLKSTLRKPRLFLGLPTYAGMRYNLMQILGALQNQRSFSDITTMEVDSSLLASAFNLLLVNALNRRDSGEVDYFLLMHADIVPLNTQGWLDEFFSAKQAAKAEAIAAVVPIKDIRGVTSTALDNEENVYAPTRLTMSQIASLPETFTDPRLLINTGLLMFDLKNAWADKVYFTIGDTILRMSDGKRAVGTTPEDWDFSRQLMKLGVQRWATKAVKLNHVGRFSYPNSGVWGTSTVDQGDWLDTGMKKAEPAK